MRGNHQGSFEVAHALARYDQRDWGPVESEDKTLYDLVIVGGGVSGLSSAYFYLHEHPEARILILDNHDDFGGHAKRNEFTVGGRTVIGYGGSEALEDPHDYPELVQKFLAELGVELDRFETAYDQNFYRKNGLGGGVFFNRRDWGVDRLVRYDLGNVGGYIPLAASSLSVPEAVAQMPLSNAARAEMAMLLSAEKDALPGIPKSEREDYLYSISYREYLEKHMGITEAEVFSALQDLAIDSGVGIESASAEGALFYMLLPGLRSAGMPELTEAEPYIFHFPDGNASIARLLVRQLIPGVATGSSMEDVVTANFDYSALDKASNPVRLRLNSTVVNVEHAGDAATANHVSLSYVRQGKAHTVRARHCILACYHSGIPSLCTELPEQQREALSYQQKTPTLYTNVALRNWQACKKLGLGAFVAPGGYHARNILDFPVSIGDYHYGDNPEDPAVIHMERFPHRANQGLSQREQHRLGQQELLTTPFETIERHVREQLAATLAGGGFDPVRDIEGITVNRWAHGSSYGYDWAEDPYYDDWDDPRYPHVQARQPFGRITIANSDAAATANLPSAVEQAYRAVSELA
jgi:spermidine dehydrogenase